jgi:hypothetical protein
MSSPVNQLPIYFWLNQKSKESASLAYWFVSKWDTAMYGMLQSEKGT